MVTSLYIFLNLEKKQHYVFLMLSSLSTANNEGLEVLDLSWNHLRMKGAVAFCAGLKVWMCNKLLILITDRYTT